MDTTQFIQMGFLAARQTCRCSRLSASYIGLCWFHRSRRITFCFLLFSFVPAIIGRRDVLKLSGVEGERDGALSCIQSQSKRDMLAHFDCTSFVKLTAIMAPN